MALRHCVHHQDETIEMLYKGYKELHLSEDDTVKTAYDELYKAMDGIPLEKMDTILYPVSNLCSHHERIGFCDGVRIGLRLALDLGL